MRLFLKYLKVGVVNSLLGLFVILICLNFLKLNYNVSYLLGYVVGLINSFILNKSYTFNNTMKWNKVILPFFILFIVSYVISHIVLLLLIEVLYLEKNTAIVISMIIYTLIGFILNKKLFQNKNFSC